MFLVSGRKPEEENSWDQNQEPSAEHRAALDQKKVIRVKKELKMSLFINHMAKQLSRLIAVFMIDFQSLH